MELNHCWTCDGKPAVSWSFPSCFSAQVRTTGQLHVGASGGIWAELDVTAGEKKGGARAHERVGLAGEEPAGRHAEIIEVAAFGGHGDISSV